MSIKFPQLYFRRDKMGLSSVKILQKGFTSIWAHTSFYEEYLSVFQRRHVKIEHSFHPVLHLGTRNIATRRPGLRLAFDNNFWIL